MKDEREELGMDVIVFLKEEKEYIEWRDSLEQAGEELSICLLYTSRCV